jgi:hypothetical protein
MKKVAQFVYEEQGNDRIVKFHGKFNHKNVRYCCGTYKTIKEAQVAVDMKRLSLGLNAIVLKSK